MAESEENMLFRSIEQLSQCNKSILEQIFKS